MIDLTRRDVLRLGGLALGSAVVGPSLFGCDFRFADPPLLWLARPEPGLAVASFARRRRRSPSRSARRACSPTAAPIRDR